MAETMTAALAVIKIRGQAVGKARQVNVTETYRRGRVTGIGRVTADELPLLEITCTVNFGFYMIDLRRSTLTGSLDRGFDDTQRFVDNLLLQEEGIDVVLLKKVLDSESNGKRTARLEEFATIRNAFADRDSFDISEGQISGKNQDFTYTEPILLGQGSVDGTP